MSGFLFYYKSTNICLKKYFKILLKSVSIALETEFYILKSEYIGGEEKTIKLSTWQSSTFYDTYKRRDKNDIIDNK